MLIMTFFGTARSEKAEHAHESSPLLWIPLVILAVGVAFAGVLELSPDGRLASYLEPVTGVMREGTGLSFLALAGIAVAVAIVSLAIAWWVYGSGRIDPNTFRARMEPMATAAQHGWYVDRAYDVVFIQPAKALARLTGDVVDAKVIDGAVNGVAGLVKRAASGGRLIQTGFVRTYALVLFVGAVAVLGYIGVRV